MGTWCFALSASYLMHPSLIIVALIQSTGASNRIEGIYSPDISKVTVERTLTDLVKSGYIAKVGAGPSTGYVRI